MSTASGTRRPMIAGNWKMYKTRDEAKSFVHDLYDKIKRLPQGCLPVVVIAPPATALQAVRKAIKKLDAPFLLAAQTMDSHNEGAYTGEISPLMLKDLDVNPVIIGHSERRQYFNETDQSVNAKVHAALKHHISPIICVGETLAQRESGETDGVIERQVSEALRGVEPKHFEHLVFAYEPVWAIGTGKVCDATEANRVCGLIRQILDRLGNPAGSGGGKTRVLYGGSVKPDNIKELMAQSDIDGALVGGASLDPGSFAQLVEGGMLVNA